MQSFWCVDPLASDFASWSTYSYVFNNPLRFIDPDGRAPDDIVYYNSSGSEIHRIESNTVFKTYVANQSSMTSAAAAGLSQFSGGPVHDRFFTEAAMPNIIQNRSSAKGAPATTGAAYQANDYEIAAQTFIFNRDKNAGTLSLATEGGNSIPSASISDMPNLDPTMVKALGMQESSLGVGTNTTDILQTNNAGDWNGFKSSYGLTNGQTPSASTSVSAGIRILGTKGFRGGVTYNTKTGASTYTFQGWNNAIEGYNGGGTAGYQANVQRMINESVAPTDDNY